MKPLALAPALLFLWSCSRQEPPPPAPAPSPPKITQFYAAPASVPPRGRALLCYGVENAASVTIEPAVEPVKPSLARCVEVRPATTTTYRLTVRGSANLSDSATATIAVDPRAAPAPPPTSPQLIETFSASATEVAAGQPVTLCFVTSGADSVTLSPPVPSLTAPGRACSTVTLSATTTYTLTARSASGATDRETLTVHVR